MNKEEFEKHFHLVNMECSELNDSQKLVAIILLLEKLNHNVVTIGESLLKVQITNRKAVSKDEFLKD